MDPKDPKLILPPHLQKNPPQAEGRVKVGVGITKENKVVLSFDRPIKNLMLDVVGAKEIGRNLLKSAKKLQKRMPIVLSNAN